MNPHQTLRQIKEAVRAKFAFPGGYKMHLVMMDGEPICMDCARKEWRLIYWETKLYQDGDRYDKQWATMGADIYWEGPPMQCAHCNKDIESEYGDPEEQGNGNS